MPASDRDHRTALRDVTLALYTALQTDQKNPDETSAATANEEVRLLQIME